MRKKLKRNISGFIQDEVIVPEFDIYQPKIYLKEVQYDEHKGVTRAFFNNGDVKVCKTHGGDSYNREFGLIMCMLKEFMGNSWNVHELLEDWYSEDTDKVTISDVRKKLKIK